MVRFAALSVLLLSVSSMNLAAEELSDADKAVNNTVTLGSGAAPTEWLGAEPHFVMVGQFKDFTFDIHTTDLSAVELAGKREYGPIDGGLAYIDFEVALNLVTDGIERSIELEFENADFSKHPVPSSY